MRDCFYNIESKRKIGYWNFSMKIGSLNHGQIDRLNAFKSVLGQGFSDLKNKVVGIDWAQRSVDQSQDKAQRADRDAWLATFDSINAQSKVSAAEYQANQAMKKSLNAKNFARSADNKSWLAEIDSKTATKTLIVSEDDERALKLKKGGTKSKTQKNNDKIDALTAKMEELGLDPDTTIENGQIVKRTKAQKKTETRRIGTKSRVNATRCFK